VLGVVGVHEDRSHEAVPDLTGPDLPGPPPVEGSEYPHLGRGREQDALSGAQGVDIRGREALVAELEGPAPVLGHPESRVPADEDSVAEEGPPHGVGPREAVHWPPGLPAVGGGGHGVVSAHVEAGGVPRVDHQGMEVATDERASFRRSVPGATER
jgi:hypothetical protein